MKKVLRLILFIVMATILLISCSGNEQINAPIRQDAAYRLDIPLEGSLQNPAFSPDGKSIVFTRFRDGYNEGASDLFIYNLDTEELTILISDGNGNVNLPGSVWNEEIDSIVFSSAREPHDEIFLISEAERTGKEIQITSRTSRQSFEPSFSPNGEWIVFESHAIDVENDGVVTKYKVDGSSEYINLTPSADNCRQPNWSPRGDRILYQKETDGQWDIWIMNIDGSEKMMLRSGDGDKTDAVFSYDGAWIIYSSENDEVELANIYGIPILGGVPIRMTYSDGYDGAPSISPDGRQLAFESAIDSPEISSGTTIWVLDFEEGLGIYGDGK